MIWCTIGDFFHPIPPKKGNLTLSFNATHYSPFFHMVKSLISASTYSVFSRSRYRVLNRKNIESQAYFFCYNFVYFKIVRRIETRF